MYEENTVMPVTPMGNNGGFGGDWGWIILLLLFAGGFGGFGGGYGGAEIYPWMNQADITTSGFQNLATQNQLTGVQSSLGDIQTALCGGFAGVNATVSNGFAQAEIANNARQIADLQQSFASQTAITGAIADLAAQNASCCCEQRLASCQLQNTIQSENCADRAAISEGIRDILVANNANTQRILDMMCQDKIDAKNEKILELQNQLNIATFNASQVAQNNYLSNALTAQTQYILGVYPPTTATTTPATARA